MPPYLPGGDPPYPPDFLTIGAFTRASRLSPKVIQADFAERTGLAQFLISYLSGGEGAMPAA